MISIITPVYNGEKFIEACIKVVIEQNCPDVEHIIVDGGSTDLTVEIIKKYAENYPHIRWISEKDQGQSDAMNKGIAMAKGEILSFLNVDDYYEPNVINKATDLFRTLPEPSLLVGNCNVWDEKNKLSAVYKPSNFSLINLVCGLNINNFPINPSSYFYHTSLHQKAGLYNVNEHYAMDLDFLLRAVQVATVKYVDEVWGNWMKTEETKSMTLWQTPELGYQLVDRILGSYRKNLPLLERSQAAIQYSFDYYWSRYFKFRIKYYLINPQKLLPLVRKKMIGFVKIKA
jgi:glycosyltransferase involved in cell wall biosynthesis